MADPTNKAPELENMLERLFGRTTNIQNNKCVICGGDASDFEDELSRKEYNISGLCQTCQNETFGG